MEALANFIEIDFFTASQVVVLGFVGGVLSGFIGTGGAFFMTPGMMNLGVPGIVAVGSNIAHKFGKAIIGAKKHGQMGHVDRKLGLYMLMTAVIGIAAAVWINESLLESPGGESAGSAVGDLYISSVFVVVLAIISIVLLKDVIRSQRPGEGPSTHMADACARIKLPPLVSFRTADIRVSFWLIAVVGLLTGYLAGTIGVGGFLGVPAMIYILGVPTAVAAGTELYLAIFMGAWGAISYAWGGHVDLRLTLLLYLGSLAGIYIGAYGTKVVKEEFMRLLTGVVILLCVISRALTIPIYLDQIGYWQIASSTAAGLNLASKLLLFTSGIGGVLAVLFVVARAWRARRKVQVLLQSLNE